MIAALLTILHLLVHTLTVLSEVISVCIGIVVVGTIALVALSAILAGPMERLGRSMFT